MTTTPLVAMKTPGRPVVSSEFEVLIKNYMVHGTKKLMYVNLRCLYDVILLALPITYRFVPCTM
jgi:hypothetical protein